MKIKGCLKAASAAAIALVTARVTTVAHAAEITRTFDVQASAFGVGAPVNAVTLDFTVSFDPTMTTNTTTNGLAIRSFTLPDSSEFDYTPLLQFGSLFSLTDVLTVGTDVISPEIGGAIAANQYILAINNTASATPQLDYFDYFTGSLSSEVYTAGDLSLTVSDVPAAPEPSSWLLMIAGVGVVGAVLRRRGKTAFCASPTQASV